MVWSGRSVSAEVGSGDAEIDREVVLSITLTGDGRAQEQLWTRLRHQVGVRSGRSGKEFESFGVGGANDPEVAFIEGSDDGLVEPFGDRDDRRVGRIETNVLVTVNKFGDASPVGGGEGLDM